MGPNLILLISFLIFMALAFRYGYKKSITALDTQIDEVRHKLDNAIQQKDEALVMLSQQRQAYSETLQYAESLETENTEKLKILKRKLMEDLEQLVRKKEAHLDDLMKRFHQESIAEIRKNVGEITELVIKRYVEKTMTDKDQEKLTDVAIDEIIMTLNIANGNTHDVPVVRESKKAKIDLGVVS